MAKRSAAPADAAPQLDAEAVADTLPPPRHYARCVIWHGWTEADGSNREARFALGDEIPAARAAEMDPGLYESR